MRCPITRSRSISFVILVTWLSLATSLFSQSKTVGFDIAYGSDLPVGVVQSWMKTLQTAGVKGIRIAVKDDQDVRIVEDRTGASVTVFGRIDRNQRLVVPNRTFKLSDTKQIREWVGDFTTTVADADKKRGAFGLTATELVGVFVELGTPLSVSTQDQNVSDIVDSIGKQLQFKIAADSKAESALADVTKIPEELKGVSCGTALAAIVRPLGLVVTIDKARRRIQLVESRDANEHWPIGWPPQQRPGIVAPTLFKKTKVDIEDFPLDEVLGAISAKIKLPVIYDQNTLARYDVEMQKIEVTVRPTELTYDKIIRDVLSYAKPKLSYELRVDEIGQPFLWVTKPGRIDQ